MNWKITLHRNDGEPAHVYRTDADTSAEALLQAAQYALERGLDVKTIEIEEE